MYIDSDIWNVACSDVDRIRLNAHRDQWLALVNAVTNIISEELFNKLSHHYKICGFHSGDYDECSLVGCCAVWLL
jgi:hypothetical protein